MIFSRKAFSGRRWTPGLAKVVSCGINKVPKVFGATFDGNIPLLSTSFYFLKNGPTPASFCLFSSFKTNITIFTTNKYEKCPTRIRCWDSNPQPSQHESPPITTRGGLLSPPSTLYELPASCTWRYVKHSI